MKVTKSIMSGLAVLAMAFVLVCSNANSGLAYRIPYPCGVQSPAYLDYTDARPAPCDLDASHRLQTPDAMGSPGF